MARISNRALAQRESAIGTDISSGNEYGLERVKEMARTQAPLRRIGRPDEVAAMAVFLASDEASYCTGVCFDVSGGR